LTEPVFGGDRARPPTVSARASVARTGVLRIFAAILRPVPRPRRNFTDASANPGCQHLGNASGWAFTTVRRPASRIT
jgi:hypothetical protein